MPALPALLLQPRALPTLPTLPTAPGPHREKELEIHFPAFSTAPGQSWVLTWVQAQLCLILPAHSRASHGSISRVLGWNHPFEMPAPTALQRLPSAQGPNLARSAGEEALGGLIMALSALPWLLGEGYYHQSTQQTVLFQHGAAQPSQATSSRGLLDTGPQPSPSQGWQPGTCPCGVHAGWGLGQQGEQQDVDGVHRIMESQRGLGWKGP